MVVNEKKSTDCDRNLISFEKGTGYINMPNSRQLLSCVLTKMPGEKIPPSQNAAQKIDFVLKGSRYVSMSNFRPFNSNT